MPDELIDIVDKKGNPTGVQHMKSYAHKNGLLHASVHIWIQNDQREILFQQRALNKDTFPGLWDVSVAGHIAADENPKIAALREVGEEIGIALSSGDLHFIGTWHEEQHHNDYLIDNEIHFIYMVKALISLEDVSLQEEEVMAVRLLSIDTFTNSVNKKELSAYVPHDIAYYKLIIKALTQQV